MTDRSQPVPSTPLIGSPSVPTTPVQRLARVPSFVWSDPSPSKSLRNTDLPDLTDLDLRDAPEEWVTKLRKYVQSFVYRLMNLNRRVLIEFEKCGATHYKDYQFLKENSAAMWQSWRDFAGSEDITSLVIRQSPLYFDIPGHIRKMNAPKDSKKQELFRSFRSEAVEINATVLHG